MSADLTPEQIQRYKLRNLKIPRVDLVDRGANQHADIVIYKSDGQVVKRTPEIRRALEALNSKKEANKKKKALPMGGKPSPFGGKPGTSKPGASEPGAAKPGAGKKPFPPTDGKPSPADSKKKKKPVPFAKTHPINTINNLREAIQAVGATAAPVVKQHITRRAVDLGVASMIPQSWASKSTARRAKQ